MNKKVLIITHFFATGPAQELVEYLKDKVSTLAFIEHPFSFSDKTQSSMICFEKGQVVRTAFSPKIRGHEIVLYLKDFVYSILFVIKTKTKFDVCIAADNLNAFSSLFLKKLGFVKTVVFYTVDYTPNRFRNRLLNSLYHLLDRVCCYRSDCVWNSSELMEIERRKRGINSSKSARQIVVPDGTHFERIKRLSIDRINRFDVVFIGHLVENKGIELLIDAFPLVLNRVPQARLIIVGDGSIKKKLQEMARVRGVEDKVDFKGFITSHREVENLLTHCAVAVAPYVPDPDSFSYYSDVSKPKVYMATGLPIVITRVPTIAYEIEKNGAGFAVYYDTEQIVDGISRLLLDDNLYIDCRKKAIQFGSQFQWQEIFKTAFNKTGIELKANAGSNAR